MTNMAYERNINLLHYLLMKQRFAVADGLVDLRHVLWYTDVMAFAKLGRPISSFVYARKKEGPVPFHFSWTMNKLVSRGALGGGGADYLAYSTAFLNPIRNAKMDVFSLEEIKIIDTAYSIISANGYGGGRLPDSHLCEKIITNTPVGAVLNYKINDEEILRGAMVSATPPYAEVHQPR